MRARLDRAPGDALGEAAQIALEGIEIDHQSRGVDLVERHADLGGRAGGHRRISGVMAQLGEAYLACGKMQLRHPVITIEAHFVRRVERAPAARNANGYQY